MESLIEWKEVSGLTAPHVVPPITDEELLSEDGTVRAEKAVLLVVDLAVVEHLQTYHEQSALDDKYTKMLKEIGSVGVTEFLFYQEGTGP